MKKARITIMLEYDMNPAHYPEGATGEQMINVDLENNAMEQMVAYAAVKGKVSVVRKEAVGE